MTRPDLRALVAQLYFSTADVESFAVQVAAHERARIVKELRSICDKGFESIPIWKLRKIADELEADHG